MPVRTSGRRRHEFYKESRAATAAVTAHAPAEFLGPFAAPGKRPTARVSAGSGRPFAKTVRWLSRAVRHPVPAAGPAGIPIFRP